MDTNKSICQVRPLEQLVVEQYSSKPSATVEHHSYLVWLLSMVNAMMGYVLDLTLLRRNKMRRYLASKPSAIMLLIKSTVPVKLLILNKLLL